MKLKAQYRLAETNGLAVAFSPRMKASCEKWCESPGVGDVVDEFIIWQAGNFGLRILLSDFVNERVMKLYFDRAKLGLQKRFLKACEDSIARIHVKQGDLRPQLTDPVLYEGRKETIPELDSLFRQIAKTLGSKRIPAGPAAVIKQFRSLAATNSPNVHRNLNSIAKYLAEEAGAYYMESLRAGKTVRAAQFFDDWSSHHNGYSAPYFRRKITELGPGR
jgi:hypothetical protein